MKEKEKYIFFIHLMQNSEQLFPEQAILSRLSKRTTERKEDQDLPFPQ